MNEDNFIPNTNNNINEFINLCEIKEKIREVIRDNFPQYLDSVNTASVTKSPDIIVDNSNFFEDIFNQVTNERSSVKRNVVKNFLFESESIVRQSTRNVHLSFFQSFSQESQDYLH